MRDGTAATEHIESPSVVHRFAERVRELGAKVALHQRVGDGWRTLSWAEWYAASERLASALISLGVKPGDHVAIIANTRIEWAVADIGISMAGAITTPIYASSTTEQVLFILRDCDAKVVLCESTPHLPAILRAGEELPSLVHVVDIDGLPPESALVPASSWAQLDELGGAALPQSRPGIDAYLAAVRPDHLATLVYTSGTSGVAKGVRISHQSLLYASATGLVPLAITSADVQLMFLPLAHIIAKALLVSSFHTGCSTAMDANPVNVMSNCRELGITFFPAVPRVLDRFRSELGGLSAAEIAARFGGKLRFVLTGGAALSTELIAFFDAAGLPIYQGYGLTESGGGLALNLPGASRAGSVGRPPPGTLLHIAEDGEVLASGPGVMLGYHARPDEEALALGVRDGQRWLHTGDIGSIDADGFLWITDRKKDIFKTSSGKYIAPAHLESVLKAASPLISQALVYGENRNYVTALVTLNVEELGKLAVELGFDPSSQAVVEHPTIRSRLLAALEKANAGLAAFERIRDVAVVHPDFSREEGDLTPTIKLRRQAILRKHRALLDGMYARR